MSATPPPRTPSRPAADLPADLPAAGQPWPAPVADGPVDAVVTVPGSKSATNRALVLAALADGPSRLTAPLRARDTLLMAAGLRALGVRIDDVDGDDSTDEADWLVHGTAVLHPPVGAHVDCGNAGTVARFLPAVATLGTGPVVFDGDPRMRERPLGALLTALRRLGARIDGERMPLTVLGDGALPGGTVEIDASASSQLVTGLLLAAPRFDHGVRVRHSGPPVPSAPHLAMTVAALRAAGARVDTSRPHEWAVEPGPLRAGDQVIEPDLSSAAPFLAAAVATGGRVLLAGWPQHTEQPGRLLPDLLAAMGATVSAGPAGLAVQGPARLTGIDVDLHEYGEVTPVLTALAVLAETPSRLRGVAHLRLQETDRLAALATELGRLGARIAVTEDGLDVTPAPLSGARLDPRADHRLAMAYAVVGLAVPGVLVDDVATTGKTVPDFPARWAAMLRPDGPARPGGAGSTTRGGTARSTAGGGSAGGGRQAGAPGPGRAR